MRLLPLILLATACTRSAPLRLPNDDVGSFLLAFPGETLEVHAFDGDDAVPPLTIDQDAQVHLLTYDRPLLSLGIPAGRLEAPSATSSATRPLPWNFTAFRASLRQEQWTEIESADLPEEITALRLPGFDVGACELRDGCYRFAENRTFCELPCVEPAERPDPPEPVRAVEPPPFSACAPGWEAEEDRCTPRALSCIGMGQRFRYPGDDVCSGAAGECPAGDYADDLPNEPIVYVRAGAPAGGDGTIGAPYATLQAAFASGARLMAVAKGSYAESVPLPDGARIIGACHLTHLTGLVTTLGSGRLERMQLDRLVVGTGRSLEVHSLLLGQVSVGGGLSGERLVVAQGMTIDGTANLDEMILLGAVGLVAAGTVTLTDVRVVSDTLGIRTTGGAVDLSRVEVVSPRAVDVTGGRLQMTVAKIDGEVSVGAAELVLEEAHLQDTIVRVARGATLGLQTATASRAEVHVNDAEVSLDHTRLHTSKIVLTNADLAVSHFTSRDTLDRAIDLWTTSTGAVSLTGGPIALLNLDRNGVHVRQSDGNVQINLTDLTMVDVRGVGVRVGEWRDPLSFEQHDASVEIRRAQVRDVTVSGFDFAGGKTKRLLDLSGRSVTSLVRTAGGVIELERVALEDTVEGGLRFASGDITVRDLVVRGAPIGVDSVGWIRFDINDSLASPAVIQLDRFIVSEAVDAGIFIDTFSDVTLLSGELQGNRIGVDVRNPAFDTTLLEGDVIYRRNAGDNVVLPPDLEP